jgi:hypothetical protein
VRPEEIPPELADTLDASTGRVRSREVLVMAALARILARWEARRGEYLCGQSPPPDGCPSWLRGLECARPAGHAEGKPAERHEAGGFWWSERQQAPVQQGHVHSTGYLCSPACPAYQDRGWR